MSGFSLKPTQTMFVAQYNHNVWESGALVPFGNVSLSPAAAVLNYGQGVLEGIKAYRSMDDRIVLFRPLDHARRLSASAMRLCMPPVPESLFLNALCQLVWDNRDDVPKEGSLYIRPCIWGTGQHLGLAPAQEYTLVLYASPVGHYFNRHQEAIRICICESFHRAAPQGVGDVKCIGNYAPTLLSMHTAKANGFHGCLYLDACSHSLEEMATSNFFCVIDDELWTPRLGSILPGLIRDSVITIARSVLDCTVQERDIFPEDLLRATECFCTGTAAGIVPIDEIYFRDQSLVQLREPVGPLTKELQSYLQAIQCGQEDPFHWLVEVCP